MERLDAPVSSSVLVVELGEPRSVVNYHLRCLREEGHIACDHTDHRGSHVEHFYRLADASP